MSIDVSKIQPGDKVKVSLYGLPESGWLEVADVFAFWEGRGELAIRMPDGDQPLFPVEWITAHEPAAPALPEWWGSLVIFDADEYGVFDGADHYTFSDGDRFTLEELRSDDVTVIVDRDGNQPAAEGYRQDALTEIQNRRIVESERDKARADLAALKATPFRCQTHACGSCGGCRAAGVVDELTRVESELSTARADLAVVRVEVAKVRDDVRNLFDYQTEQRLDAILDGNRPVNADCPDLHPDDIAKAVTNSRWLAERDRAVKAEAWDRGYWARQVDLGAADTTPNPYRKGADQ